MGPGALDEGDSLNDPIEELCFDVDATGPQGDGNAFYCTRPIQRVGRGRVRLEEEFVRDPWVQGCINLGLFMDGNADCTSNLVDRCGKVSPGADSGGGDVLRPFACLYTICESGYKELNGLAGVGYFLQGPQMVDQLAKCWNPARFIKGLPFSLAHPRRASYGLIDV